MSVGKLKQAGDTIVEVMICMAIVSGSLATSYAIARRSLVRVRQAEERAQSMQLAQQQIERFKQYLKANPNVTTAPPPAPPGKTPLVTAAPLTAGFCIYSNGTLYRIPASVGPDSGPKDPHCATNEQGRFYCDPPAPVACSGVLTSTIVDNAGFTSRAAIAYTVLLTGFSADAVEHQFYATAGRFAAAGNTVNTQQFDVVVVPYRIYQ